MVLSRLAVIVDANLQSTIRVIITRAIIALKAYKNGPLPPIALSLRLCYILRHKAGAELDL